MYIVDTPGFEGTNIHELHTQLQEYLNHKHKHCHPWQLVSVVSIEKQYLDDPGGMKLVGINVTLIWRTH